MRRLSETEDDAKLDGGERLEETYKSVDYDVWLCETCGHTQKEAYPRMLTSYAACPSCKFKTMSRVKVTQRQPTTVMSGLAIEKDHCGNCGHRAERKIVIPVIVPASSSSGSSGGGGGGGGGSFGGGSSDGGGAGGSY